MLPDIGDLEIYVFTGLLLLIVTVSLVWLDCRKKSRHLREKAIEKRHKEQHYISSQLDRLSKELDEKQVEEITNLPTPELIQQLQNGTLNPDDVLRSYMYKACKVTSSLNCVTEVIRGCEDAAKGLPEKRKKELPLFGLPVSLKESIHTKGSASTIGFANLIDTIAEDDGVLAKVLKHCGAVPFVKTNVPQTTVSFESSNPIYGQTSNPHNLDFTPGGSSSGEGSILGAGASPLGFGTDAGGSIRAPSHMCGICGLKPTTNRISLSGSTPPFPLTSISASCGPMAKDVDTLVVAMRALLCDLMFELDPGVVPLKFRDEMYNCKKPMKIGYYDDDGYTKPVPACQRAVNITKTALEKAGHTLIHFKVPDPESTMEMLAKAFFADGGRTCMKKLKYDVVDECVRYMHGRWTMPRFVRKVYSMLKSHKSTRIAKEIMACGGGEEASAYNLWKTRGQIEEYKAKFWAEWRDKYEIEAMIAPAYPLVACPKGSLANLCNVENYTILYNAVNGPSGVVPVTKVTQKDIDDLANYEGHYGDEWDQHCKTACLGSIGMPVAVQCISTPWNEETCLRLMKEVETLVPGQTEM